MLALEPRVFAWRVTVLVHCVLQRAARAQMCRASVCSVHNFPSVVGKLISRPKETGPNSEKNHEWPDREECQEFQLLVVQLLRSQFVDEDDGDEGDKFPCAS